MVQTSQSTVTASSTIVRVSQDVEEFLKWRKDTSARYQGFCGDGHKSFLPIGLLKDHFKDARGGVLKRLLRAVDANHSTLDIALVRDEYAAMFAILLAIGHGDHINHFTQHGLRDALLPMTTPHDQFPMQHNIFDKFKVAQWEFCASTLPKTFFQYSPEAILLCKREEEPFVRGNSADIYRIQEYNILGELVN